MPEEFDMNAEMAKIDAARAEGREPDYGQPAATADADQVESVQDVADSGQQQDIGAVETSAEAAQGDAAGEKIDAQADPFFDMPEKARAEVERMQNDMRRLQHGWDSDRGRISAMQRQAEELQKQIEEMRAAAAATQKQSHISQDDLNELKSVWPEAFAEIEAQRARAEEAEKRAATGGADQDRRIAELEAAYRQSQIDTLRALHPDYEQVAAAPEFANWLQMQPEQIRQQAGSSEARHAAAVLDVYKAARSKAAASRESRLAANVAVPASGRPPANTPPETLEEGLKYWEKKFAERRRAGGAG